MKKTSFLFGSAVLLGVLVNAGTSFADQTQTPNPSSEQTPVTTTLTAPTTPTPKPPVDPTAPDKGGNTPQEVIGEGKKLGIAYYPKSFTFKGDLGSSSLTLPDSSNDMATEATYNIGVKDETRTTNKWTLNATLTWKNGELPGSSIAISNPDNGEVKRNSNDGVTNFDPSNLVPQSDVEGTNGATISISNSEQTIMTKKNKTVGKGTYDYSLGKVGTLKLTIPNATDLEAKTYSGNVNWNLSVTP